jgi:hypothetical protein
LSAAELLKQLTGVVSIIPHEYVDALLVLHDKWNSTGVMWIVDGDLAMSLRTVDVEPDCIEILCTKQEAQRLFESSKDLTPTLISDVTRKLPQSAICAGNQYPVYSRSHYFEFALKGIPVRVQGNLQFKVNDWEWGDTLEFQPEYISVVGKKTAVTPLAILHQLYSSLGWTEKAQSIEQVLQKRLVRHL